MQPHCATYTTYIKLSYAPLLSPGFYTSSHKIGVIVHVQVPLSSSLFLVGLLVLLAVGEKSVFVERSLCIGLDFWFAWRLIVWLLIILVVFLVLIIIVEIVKVIVLIEG